MAVVFSPLHVSIDFVFDRAEIKKPGVPDTAFAEIMEHQFFQFIPQPVFDRDGETFLAPVDVLRREKPFHSFFEDPFCGHALELEVTWDLKDIFDNLVIDQRNSCLKRRGHAHSVDLD